MTTASTDGSRAVSWSLRGGVSRTAFRRMDTRALIDRQHTRLDGDEITRVRAATDDVLDRFPGTTA